MPSPFPFNLFKAALTEDIGSGDITSEHFIPHASTSYARIITRKHAVAGGLAAAREVFREVDPTLIVKLLAQDGQHLQPGESFLEVKGSTRSLLAAERVVLNFLGRLIGVATLTRTFVEAVAGTGVTILDTRKMTPGWRLLEKEAVRAGGGKNHRIGLFDAVMIKDNHLAAIAEASPSLGKSVSSKLGALPKKIQELRADHPNIKIEVEADTLEQVKFFLTIPEINVILLDNMNVEKLREAVAMRSAMAPQIRLEASGGITLENIRAIAETGIDEISLGAVTHSVSWADLSLEIIN
ncbi:MAG: carboxylating nicotinate-nucleotide diphosphorylase [Chthoniobacterales bacterium]